MLHGLVVRSDRGWSCIFVVALSSEEDDPDCEADDDEACEGADNCAGDDACFGSGRGLGLRIKN